MHSESKHKLVKVPKQKLKHMSFEVVRLSLGQVPGGAWCTLFGIALEEGVS